MDVIDGVVLIARQRHRLQFSVNIRRGSFRRVYPCRPVKAIVPHYASSNGNPTRLVI
jgi:hypothetical protein